jgi:hypothetical protein
MAVLHLSNPQQQGPVHCHTLAAAAAAAGSMQALRCQYHLGPNPQGRTLLVLLLLEMRCLVGQQTACQWVLAATVQWA